MQGWGRVHTRNSSTYRLFVTNSIENTTTNVQEHKGFVTAATLHNTSALGLGLGQSSARERFMDMVHKIFDGAPTL